MGHPADLADTADTDSNTTGTATPPPFTPPAHKLYRDESNRVFGGVFAGLGCYTGWNANIMRLLFLLLAIFTYMWPLTIIYLIAWMIIPAARTPRQILEMTGQPVTIFNVGRTVLGTTDRAAGSDNGNIIITRQVTTAASTVGSIIGKICMGFVGIIGVGMTVACVSMIVLAVIGLTLDIGWNDSGLIESLHALPTHSSPTLGCLWLICVGIAALIPSLAAVWVGCNAVFRMRGLSTKSALAILIVEVVFIVASVVIWQILLYQHGLELLTMAGASLSAAVNA